MRTTSSGAAVRVLENNNNNGKRNMPRVRKIVLAEQDLVEIWLDSKVSRAQRFQSPMAG